MQALVVACAQFYTCIKNLTQWWPTRTVRLFVYAAVINFINAEAGAKALQQAQNVGFDCELLSEKRYLPAPLASPFPMNLLQQSPLLVLQSAT